MYVCTSPPHMLCSNPFSPNPNATALLVYKLAIVTTR